MYVIDSNVLIEAAKRYYAFDIAPAFWESLERLSQAGQISSIDRVKQELDRGNDALKDWADDQFASAFMTTDQDDVIESFRRIMNWVNTSPQYTPAAKANFANIADGWLVAYALAKNAIVVTDEVYRAEKRSSIPIPVICQAFELQYVNTFAMLRALGIRLA